MYRRKRKCFFCKSEGCKTLKKNALKLVKTRYKDVTQEDAFCNSCYHKIQALLRRTVAKRRMTSTAISATSSVNDASSSFSSSRSYNSEDSLDRLLIEAERKNAAQKRVRNKQDVGEVPDVRPILPSDADDSVSISDEVPGPSSLANVQPLIRRRRKPIIFTDEKTVPIYNRRHYGG